MPLNPELNPPGAQLPPVSSTTTNEILLDLNQVRAETNGLARATRPQVTTHQCERCDDWFSTENNPLRITIDGNAVCQSCYEQDYITCDQCERATRIWNDVDLCESCAEERLNREEDNLRLRSGDLYSDIYQSARSGQVIKSKRRFGVEIELYFREREQAITAIKDLDRAVSIGTDGSIRSDGIGLEIRTPIMRGKNGEDGITAITKTLRTNGAAVNASCGLHVHLEAIDLKSDFAKVRNLFLFYLAFDDILVAMLPHYRHNNQYAKSLKGEYPLHDIAGTSNLNQLGAIWYKVKTNNESERNAIVADNAGQNRHTTRYFGTNLHSLLSARYKTLEIRYHSPTLSPTKILNWIALHQAIIDNASKLDYPKILRANELIFFEDRLKAFIKLAKLSPELASYVKGRIVKFNPTKKNQLCAE